MFYQEITANFATSRVHLRHKSSYSRRRRYRFWCHVVLLLAIPATVLTLDPRAAKAEDVKFACPKNAPPTPKIKRRQVYAGVPFKAGEEAVYEVTWGVLKAGYGTLSVHKPKKHKGVWHRVFRLNASTGDWFKAVLVAKEKFESISRPWDFGIGKFYMHQNEGKMFSQPFVQEKWLDFDHKACKVHERIQKPGKPEKNETFDLAPGAIDALGVIYHMRSKPYTVGKTERAPVYTSEKNWYLDADPQAIENVQVPAGTFKAVKLKLRTYIGKELQQKGDVYAWIATEHPSRPLVQLQGEIKIGSVWVKLHRFKAGK